MNRFRYLLRLHQKLLVGIVCLGMTALRSEAQLEVKHEPLALNIDLSQSEATQVGFNLLPPSQTGITFRNSLSDDLIARNQNLMNGSGVAAGDINGDGRCDLYFCGIAENNALYLNLDHWTFQDISNDAGVALANTHSTGALFGDIDGDYDLDLLVSTLGKGVQCFLNDGRGNFRNNTLKSGLSSRTGSTSLALSDIDGDSDLDLYVTNYGEIPIINSGGKTQIKKVNGEWTITGPHAKRLRIVGSKLEELGEPDTLYLNDGSGHFTATKWGSRRFLDEAGNPLRAPWDFGLAVQIRDINGDHSPDIYVCNDFQSPDRLWLNTGHGSFQLAPKIALRKESYASMGVDFSDIDRDGDLDFLVAEMLARSQARQLRQVSGARPNIPVPGKFNDRPESNRNTFFINRGDGTFAEIANFLNLAATDWSWQPVFIDVDLDRFPDLLMVNGMPHDIQNRDTLETIRRLGKQSIAESRKNFLRYPEYASPNYAFRNDQELGFVQISKEWGFVASGITHGVVLADLDNDGDLDVATNNLRTQPSLYRNESNAPRVAIRLHGLAPNTAAIGAKITLTESLSSTQTHEILAGGRYLSADDTGVTFAIDGHTSTAILEVRWRTGSITTVQEIQANRLYHVHESDTKVRPRYQVSSRTSPSTWFSDISEFIHHRHHEIISNDFTRQPLLPRLYSQEGPGVAWLDLEGDHREELVIGTGRGGVPAVLESDETGQLHPIQSPPDFRTPDDTSGMAAWISSGGEKSLLMGLSIYERGSASTGARILSLTKKGSEFSISRFQDLDLGQSNPGPLAVADIDADGDLDLFVGGRMIPGAYPLPASSSIFLQESGRLQKWIPATHSLSELGLVTGAGWSDLTGDGFPELLLSTEWGPIRLFKQDATKFSSWDPTIRLSRQEHSQELSLSQMTGLWSGIVPGDFDNDGKLDFVAGNWGRNDRLHASFKRPLILYHGSFSVPQRKDLLIFQYDSSSQEYLPETNFNMLRQLIPSLQKFNTHYHFSSVGMKTILESLPKPIQTNRVATLDSTLFLNRGDHFLAKALPAIAQWAPVFSLNVSDFNSDGNEDLFLSQNFFAFRPGHPRLDAGTGLVLGGDGTGNFESVPVGSLGIKVYGEQRGAAVGDLDRDGRTDIMVSQNGGNTRLFRNTHPETGLTVMLRGPVGNPDGIGAVIRLINNKPSPAREIHSGSGYWSVDSAIQVLGNTSKAQAVLVKWPGGSTSRFTLTGLEKKIEVHHPNAYQTR